MNFRERVERDISARQRVISLSIDSVRRELGNICTTLAKAYDIDLEEFAISRGNIDFSATVRTLSIDRCASFLKDLQDFILMKFDSEILRVSLWDFREEDGTEHTSKTLIRESRHSYKFRLMDADGIILGYGFYRGPLDESIMFEAQDMLQEQIGAVDTNFYIDGHWRSV